MDVIETLKQDVQEGRIGAERLVDLVAMLQRRVQVTNQQLEAMVLELRAAKQRIEELEKKLGGSTTKLDEAFSMREEEKRQEARGQKKNVRRSGRRNGAASSPKTKSIRRSEPSRFFPKVSRRANVSSRTVACSVTNGSATRGECEKWPVSPTRYLICVPTSGVRNRRCPKDSPRIIDCWSTN